LKIGVIFPQVEFGNDPVAVRDYAQTVEGLGFSHIAADDHVLGPNPNRPGGWKGWVTHEKPFHEPFVLFSFMAGVTQKLEFLTCVIILPQRQTVLVAKQAAALDVLSGGRLRMGIGIGWNEIEYIGLNQEFHNRGRRVEEQIAVLRQLWTQPLVNFSGRWHTVPDAGINPLPVQRPIPLWFGGHADPVLRRAARLGDGWLPLSHTAAEAAPDLEKLDRYLSETGRSRTLRQAQGAGQGAFGIEARLPYGEGKPDVWATRVREWEAAGATHLAIETTGQGFKTPTVHLAALRAFAEAVGLG
jgi:probable F420-dependent oxidoreductase